MNAPTEETTGATGRSVTVIGLGPMGLAISAALLADGHRVTVWNRTASRADDLVSRGAIRADSVAEALAANELVVVSLTDYDAVYSVLEPETAHLRGRVIANLSSDTPERAREASEWLAAHGATHLTGGVQADAASIGAPHAYTFYSGPKEAFERHRDTLLVIGATDYRGEDPGLAALYYQLVMNVFWPSMYAWLQTLAVAREHGISAREFLPYAHENVQSMSAMFEFYSSRLDADDHSGDTERLSMAVASIDHVASTARAAGVDSGILEEMLSLSRRGQADGQGAESFTSLVRTLRKPASA